MINKLNESLTKLNVELLENNLNNKKDFYDYLMLHNKNIIGIGWKTKNIPASIGFMGWGTPNFQAENKDFIEMILSKLDNKKHDKLSGENLLNLFQFAISEEFFWFSPPVGRRIEGLICPNLNTTNIFLKFVKRHINKMDIYETIELFEEEVIK